MNTEEAINAVIRNSTGAWMETYGRIWGRDRSQGVIKPKLNYLQRKIQRVVDRFEEMELPVRLIGLKPRARGSTTYFTALGYTLMRRTPTSAVFIGGQSDQTVGLWNMLKTYHSCDKFDWGNAGEVNEKGAHFSNGSRAKKETAKDVQAGIGDTYSLLHATEAARWAQFGVANAADVMANILKAVPLLPKTYVFLESTAEFASGDFYERWLQAVDADDFLSGNVTPKPGDYVRVFAPWFSFQESTLPNPLTAEERRSIEMSLDSDEMYEGEVELKREFSVTREDGRVTLGDVVEDVDWIDQLAWRRYAIEKECKKDVQNFWRDYPHSWQTAFQKSGNARFGTAGLAEIRRRAVKIRPQHCILEETKERGVAARPVSAGEAKVIIFEKPIRGCRYIVSVDPMTGITQVGGKDPDYHSVFALREGYYNEHGEWKPPAAVGRVVRSRWDIPILEPEVWKLSRFYGGMSGCPIVIEMNQDKGLTELLKLRGANLYRREVFNKIDQTTTRAYGFVTNEKTRENLIEKLAGAIRCINEPGNGIEILDVNALNQFDNFIRKPSGRSEAADGWKDDDVFGIGLGFNVIGHATTYVPPRRSLWGEPPIGGRSEQQRPGAFS